MKVYTKIVFDIETMAVLEAEFFEYAGAVAECKGAGTADAQRKEQLQLQQEAFNLQKQQFATISNAVAPYLKGTLGFSPAAMSSMTSQFLNNNAQQFQNAGQSVRQALAARGAGLGDTPVGGDYTKGIASLMGAAANSQASGILGLNTLNAQQALTNQFNAASLLSGNAASLNSPIGSFGYGASSALGDYIKAANTGFGSSFTNAFGGALGSGLGAMATGGISAGLGKMPGVGGFI